MLIKPLIFMKSPKDQKENADSVASFLSGSSWKIHSSESWLNGQNAAHKKAVLLLRCVFLQSCGWVGGQSNTAAKT